MSDTPLNDPHEWETASIVQVNLVPASMVLERNLELIEREAEIESLRSSIAAKDAEIEKWHDAFYREERRAIEYHNADQVDGGFKCWHPVSCLRNRKGGGGVHCLMCEQAAEIARLTKERDAARGACREFMALWDTFEIPDRCEASMAFEMAEAALENGT